jgi:cysteine-rich repeat protein
VGKKSILASVLAAWLGACGDPPATCEDCPTDSAVCGDGVVARAEACDDGDTLGGDGCSPTCTEETGPFETEPNDTLDGAQALPPEGTVSGSLPIADQDCYAVEVPAAGAVSAALTQGADGCVAPLAIELFDPQGVRRATALPAVTDGCTVLDSDRDTWARYLEAGTHTVCVSGFLDAPAAVYTLTVSVPDSCDDLPPLTPDPSQDIDADQLADVCDDDDDNDGVDDALDNCPADPNGPEQPFPWGTATDGLINLWLVAGPFTEGTTPGSCEPTLDEWTGDDAAAAPVLGDSASGVPWVVEYDWPAEDQFVVFTDRYSATPAPREAYAFTWLYVTDTQDVVLSLGSDDGHRVWMNGVVVGLDMGCHGAGYDQFQYPAQLQAGWNRLLVKVYDGGGAWSLVTRVFAADGVTPLTDVEASVAGPTSWVDDQSDADLDGVGDLCDL